MMLNRQKERHKKELIILMKWKGKKVNKAHYDNLLRHKEFREMLKRLGKKK
jgi:hypothetical protein